MRAHVIEDGVVVNTILVDSLNLPVRKLIDASLGGKIGDLWNGEYFETPPPTPEQLAAAKDAADTEVAREYAKLKALITMSPSEIPTWIEANVTNLAQAKDALTTLAIAVSILGRRL